MADNKLLNLNEIFNERFFRIPDFQRGFSWEEQQLQDFWEDLDILKKDHIHYTGLLTVEQVSKEKVKNKETWEEDLWLLEMSMKAYYLIDGQQRLTTSIILINEILNRISDKDDLNFRSKEDWEERYLFRRYKDKFMSFLFGYEKDNPSDEYFKTKILGQVSSSADKVAPQTLYTVNLQFAKEFFKEKLEAMSLDEVNNIFKKLTTQFKYNLYEIDDELDIYVTFETMNNRGKPLSNLELLKNRLIYLSTLLPDDEIVINKLRKDINETWKTIYEYLGKNKDKKLDDDEFLFNHWIMYFHYDRKVSGAYAKFLLNEKFTPRNIRSGGLLHNDIETYIFSLAKSIKSWYYLFNIEQSTYGNNIKLWMRRLNRVGFAAFRPLLMAAMSNNESEIQIEELLKKCERFVFLVFRMSHRPTNTKNSHFYKLASDYYQGRSIYGDKTTTTNIDHIINNIHWMTEGESGEGEEYKYHGWYDLDKFYDAIKDMFEKNNGFYSWYAIKYFLYEYEDFKKEESDGSEKRSWKSFDAAKKEQSIEHILPQTPTHESWQNALEGLKSSEVHHCTHSLGNLVLLAKNKNPKQGNRPFGQKKKRTDSNGIEVGFFNGSYSEIEVNQYSDWTPQEILDRGIRMLQFLERRWDVKLTDEQDKTFKRLLQLEFVTEQVQEITSRTHRSTDKSHIVELYEEAQKEIDAGHYKAGAELFLSCYNAYQNAGVHTLDNASQYYGEDALVQYNTFKLTKHNEDGHEPLEYGV